MFFFKLFDCDIFMLLIIEFVKVEWFVFIGFFVFGCFLMIYVVDIVWLLEF